MIQNLYPLLPRRIGPAQIAVAVALAVLGGTLWLIGARFSRPLLAVAMTISGGAIGFKSPAWFGWTMDPWTVAVLGSLILGIAGFMAHRWLAAIGLGLVVAVWAGLATLCAVGIDQLGLVPVLAPGELLWSFLAIFPQALPGKLEELVYTSIALGLLAGLAMSYFWKRLGVVLFWSMLGLTLSLLPMLCVALATQPGYLKWVPNRADGQAAILIAAVTVGAAVQWKLTFGKKKSSPGKAAT